MQRTCVLRSVPGIKTTSRPTNGIDSEDMDRIRRFLETPAYERTPEMLCPEEKVQ